MKIQKPKKKLYYSLRTAAEMLDLDETVLKKWEKDYPQLKPIRNRAGNRYYLEKDIALMFFIKKLVVEENLTPEEVREKLKDFKPGTDGTDSNLLLRTLAEIKVELHGILELLEKKVS